jgi:hypothetical protein
MCNAQEEKHIMEVKEISEIEISMQEIIWMG